MTTNTKIEWADDTVNPWWGCAKVSPACRNCYAEKMDARGLIDGGGHWGKDAPRHIRVEAAIKDLSRVARRGDQEGRPRRVFIASMADIFEDRPDLVEPRKRLWGHLHNLGRRITPMLLTKRPEVMAEWVKRHGLPDGAWVGTTVEDQRRADERIPHLLRVPAEVRFLSMEPLLEAVSLRPGWLRRRGCGCDPFWLDGCGIHSPDCMEGVQPLSWVIAGGESGPGARPMRRDWARSIRDQCVAAGVPFFFKQWGAWREFSAADFGGDWKAWHDHEVKLQEAGTARQVTADNGCIYRLGKRRAGRLLDGHEWNQLPEVLR